MKASFTSSQIFFLFYALLYFGSASPAFAQMISYNKQNDFLKGNSVWAFPINSGINFNTGVPKSFKSAIQNGTMAQDEGCASVCDRTNGDLLFYSNGSKVWNRNHQTLPNGTNLYGNGVPSAGLPAVSTTQGVCIVPIIGTSEQYYLFSLPYANSLQDSFALFYSVVDMRLNSGLGDIVAGKKNLPLTAKGMRYSEAMIAVPGNCNDIWLVLHRSDSAVYDAFHITKEGINPKPVSSKTLGPSFSNLLYNTGSMAASPQRDKIAFCSGIAFGPFLLGGYTCLAQFNATTGQITNELMLGGMSNNKDTLMRGVGRGVAFSPDGSRLYSHDFSVNALVQYDVSRHNFDTINRSKLVVSDNSYTTSRNAGGMLRLYGDSVYVCDRGFLSVIAKPNELGISCKYVHKAINLVLDADTAIGFCLPNEVVYPISGDTISALLLDTILCNTAELINGIKLEVGEFDVQYTYNWSNGRTTASINAVDTGIYWVSYLDKCHNFIVDSFKVTGEFLPSPIISIDVRKLRTSSVYSKYQWLLDDTAIDGAQDSIYIAPRNGKYRVIVFNKYGCADTSDVYEVTNIDDTHIGNNGMDRDGILIYPNPTTNVVYINSSLDFDAELINMEGKVLQRYRKARILELNDFCPGIYYVRLVNQHGIVIKHYKVVKVK